MDIVRVYCWINYMVMSREKFPVGVRRVDDGKIEKSLRKRRPVGM